MTSTPARLWRRKYTPPAKAARRRSLKTLGEAKANLAETGAEPAQENPAECITGKGYHSREVLKSFDDGPWKTRIAGPEKKAFSRWRGGLAARRAVTSNRTRLASGIAKQGFKLRVEIVERCFAHVLDRGGMRRTHLRGRENVQKRYLLHVAGHNLSLLMREIMGSGTPKGAASAGKAVLLLISVPGGPTVLVMTALAGHIAVCPAIVILPQGRN